MALPALVLPAVAVLPGCADAVDTPEASLTLRGNLESQFASAASEFGVPVELLKAVAYAETRWQMVQGAEEFEGQAPAFGIMALRGAALTEGARLAGVSEAQARTDVRSNLRAGAALLRSYADASGVARGDVGAWAPVVARYSGIVQADGQAQYVHNDVYGVLASGVAVQDGAGASLGTISAVRATPDFPAPSALAGKTASADYAPAVWRPSPNYNSRPSGVGPAMVIIHTCEGSYTSCWSWLTDPDAPTSAHYVVNESGSEVSQLVLEANRAWHIGASYDCSLNGGTDCFRNGTSSNNFTIGIEHGGYASQSSFPAGQITASAKLSCDISKSWGIPRDVYHFVAHGKLQPYNRTDPGPNWPWTNYLSQINSECNSTIVVDNNSANNDPAVASYAASANWTSTTATPGYYGGGYAYASTEAKSDPATFSFYLPAAATKTVDAWWTSGTNRSTTAPFVVSNASGTQLGTVSVNQQVNGGQWNVLGTYTFSAGWNTVKVSRWAAEGSVVIADAIRVR